MLLKSIANKLVVPTCRADWLSCDIESYLDPKPYLRYHFETKMEQFKTAHILLQNEEKLFRKRCQDFLLSLCKQ